MDSNAYERAIDAIAGKNNIDSPEFVRRMRGIATLASDWMGSVTSRRRSFEEFLAKTRQIVAGTCVGLGRSSLGLTSARFDLVVVDEAARCTPSELAVPVQAGRWILLVGDHCQLEPFHQPVVIRETQRRLKIPTKDVIRSDFERAFASVHGRQFGQTLLTQYRMLPAIGKLISDAFYDGRLDHGREKPILPDDVCPDFLQRQLAWVCTDSLDEQAFQTRQRNTGTSLANHVEANAIVDILRRLDDHQPFVDWLAGYDDGRKPIGIICTYAAQRELIRQKLRSVGLSGTLLKSCKIDTVDSYQGKENPLVILSLVRNNADGHLEVGERTIAQGFMARANRINVGLSRAMDRLIIVGASQRWPSDSPMARVASLFERLYEENLAEFLAPSRIEDLPRRAKGTRQKTSLKESTNDEGER
jgi:superfamily I DNA and/or RNA helicase